MGCNKKSPGLDLNILVCCLIVFGTSTVAASEDSTAKAPVSSNTVVDDLASRSAPKKKKKPKVKPLDPLMELMTPLFGSNAEKVRAIFESWTAYAEVFQAIQDPWEQTSTEYKEQRATRLYRAHCTATSLVTSHLLAPG